MNLHSVRDFLCGAIFGKVVSVAVILASVFGAMRISAQESCLGAATGIAANGAILRTRPDQTFSAVTKTGRLLAHGETACVTEIQLLTDPATGLRVRWYRLSGGDWVYQSVVSFAEAPQRPTASAVAQSPSPTLKSSGISPSSTQAATPTRIQTNTPIPPAEITRTAQQYAIEWCWIPPSAPADSPGVCSLLPLGSRFTSRVVQIQP